MKLIVAVLETMWDWRGMTSGAGRIEAEPYFIINPNNYSGKRLYKLVGANHLLVTNACRMLARSPNEHGKGDVTWLRQNLINIELIEPIDVLLVCGRIAQQTFALCRYKTIEARVIYLPHPAARTFWTREKIAEVAKDIQQ